jgi:hypothetical protein
MKECFALQLAEAVPGEQEIVSVYAHTSPGGWFLLLSTLSPDLGSGTGGRIYRLTLTQRSVVIQRFTQQKKHLKKNAVVLSRKEAAKRITATGRKDAHAVLTIELPDAKKPIDFFVDTLPTAKRFLAELAGS